MSASAKGKLSRAKGRRWQAELAKRWRDSGLFPDAASSQGAQTRSGRIGRTPPDVDGTSWWVEAKHQRRPNAFAALEQAETEAAAASDDRPAVAVVRLHGTGPDEALVALRLSVFEDLLRNRGE